MNIDIYHIIMSQMISSRGSLFSIPAPQNADHLPSISNIHWRKASHRGQMQLAAARRTEGQCGDH